MYQSINHTVNHYFIVRSNVDQRAVQLSLPHVGMSITERNRTTNIKPINSSYNTPCIKHKLAMSIYSNNETSLAMSTIAMWCRTVQSRDVRSHVFSRPGTNKRDTNGVGYGSQDTPARLHVNQQVARTF